MPGRFRPVRRALAAMRDGGLLGYPSYPVDPEPRSATVGSRVGTPPLGLLDSPPSTSAPSARSRGTDSSTTSSASTGCAPSRSRPQPVAFVIDSVARGNSLGMPCTLARSTSADTCGGDALGVRSIQGAVLHKVFLSEGWAVGPVPSEAALDLHLEQLPDDLDVEWFAVPYSHSDPAVIERLSRAAPNAVATCGSASATAPRPIRRKRTRTRRAGVRWARDAGHRSRARTTCGFGSAWSRPEEILFGHGRPSFWFSPLHAHGRRVPAARGRSVGRSWSWWSSTIGAARTATSNCIAAAREPGALLATGVRHGTHVGVLAPNGPEWVAG